MTEVDIWQVSPGRHAFSDIQIGQPFYCVLGKAEPATSFGFKVSETQALIGETTDSQLGVKLMDPDREVCLPRMVDIAWQA